MKKHKISQRQLMQAARAIQEYPPGTKSDVLIPRSIKLAENGFRAVGFEVDSCFSKAHE